MTRTISRGLAPLVTEFETERPVIVTLSRIAEAAAAHHLDTPARILAARLVERGWLIPTGIAGAYEFAPGSHAGAYSSKAPALPFAAVLATRPDFPGVVTGSSAAWAHGFLDRCPPTLHLAVPSGTAVPAGLRRLTTVHRHATVLPPLLLKGVPTQRNESLLVWLAAEPTQTTYWQTVAEWLPEAAFEADPELLERELNGRPDSVRVRLGYLLQSLRPDIAERMHPHVRHKVWFGPRGPLVRHSQHWQIADTVLPYDPAALVPLGEE